MHLLLKVLLCSCLCLEFSQIQFAKAAAEINIQENKELKSFVEDTANDAIKMIADPSKTDTQIKLGFKKIVTEKFDMEKISSSILGANRKSLKSLDENESSVAAWKNTHNGQGYYDSFASLTTNMLIKLYCSKFKDYKDATLRVTEVTPKGKDHQFWDVTSIVTLNNGKPPIKVIWTIRRNSKGQLRVIDAKVENVSMKKTLQDGVSGMISTNKTLQLFMNEFWTKYHQL